MPGFAILLVGDETHTFGGHRFYANDLWLWMRLLHRRFGVEPGRMVPLYATGGRIGTTEPDGSFDAAPATREQLMQAFARARTTLEADAPFFFVVSNHGTRPPDAAAILLARRDVLTPEQLTAEAELVPTHRKLDEDGEWPILFDPDDVSGTLRVRS